MTIHSSQRHINSIKRGTVQNDKRGGAALCRRGDGEAGKLPTKQKRKPAVVLAPLTRLKQMLQYNNSCLTSVTTRTVYANKHKHTQDSMTDNVSRLSFSRIPAHLLEPSTYREFQECRDNNCKYFLLE